MLVTVLRWIVVGIAALLVVGALGNFALYVIFEAQPPLARARRLGAWIRLVGLGWFNVEIWGRVVHAIITWK